METDKAGDAKERETQTLYSLEWEEITSIAEREDSPCGHRTDRMTVRVIHEIKNDLGGILAMGRFLREHTDALGQPVADLLCRSVERSLQNSLQTLACARNGSVHAWFAIRDALEQAADAVRCEMPEDIELETVGWEYAGFASGDMHAAVGVLINLLLNARDAMPGGGRLTVSAEMGARGETLLRVRDTGSGMQEAALRNIFRPYYTTKEKGTGLGLDHCCRAVASMGGSMRVISAPGWGTEFALCFPAAPEVR